MFSSFPSLSLRPQGVKGSAKDYTYLFLLVGKFLFSLEICTLPLPPDSKPGYSHCSPPAHHVNTLEVQSSTGPLGGQKGLGWSLLSYHPPGLLCGFLGFVFGVAATLLSLSVCPWVCVRVFGRGVSGHVGVHPWGFTHQGHVKAYLA